MKNQKLLEKMAAALAIVAVIMLFGIVGKMDHDDAVQAVNVYCENVKAGIWPDYDRIYDKECK